MNTEKITYIQYARKSTEGDDRQVLSIDGQLNDNAQVIKRNSLLVVDTIIDDASAAIPYNRPGYTDMIRRIKKGEASGIVVWHIDRIVRNELEEGEFKWLLQTGVIKSIWTPNREYRSGDNILMLSIETSMASQYSRDLSVKVKRGMRQKHEMGQPTSFAPIGYLNTKFAAHGTNYIVEDPERFHIIRKAFDLILSGKYDVPEIIAIMTNEYGLRTKKTKRLGGGPISRTTMYGVFTDPFYSGYFKRNGIMYKGAYKPMITVEEYDRVQAILGRDVKAKQHKHEFAFTGLMKCGSCGCSITASRKTKIRKSDGAAKSYTHYHCTKRKGASACMNKKYTTQKEMEVLIEAELTDMLLIPQWKAWAIETIKLDYADEVEKQSKLLNDTIAFERKLLQALDTLIDLRISSEITEEQYNQKKAEKQAELIRVQDKRHRLENNMDDWQQQLNEELDFAENALQDFRKGNPKVQKGICVKLGSDWVLHEKTLTFTRREWFVDLKKLKQYYEENKERFGLPKTFAEYRQSPYYEVTISSLRSMRDHIRMKSEKSNSARSKENRSENSKK